MRGNFAGTVVHNMLPIISLHTATADYTPVSRAVTIPGGSNRGCLDVPILDDAIVEPDETIILVASLDPSTQPMVSLVDNTATITILDFDSKFIA